MTLTKKYIIILSTQCTMKCNFTLLPVWFQTNFANNLFSIDMVVCANVLFSFGKKIINFSSADCISVKKISCDYVYLYMLFAPLQVTS